MRFIRSIIQILTVLAILLLPACTPKNNNPQELPTGTPGLVIASHLPSAQPGTPPGGPSSPTNITTPVPTAAVTMTQGTPDITWRDAPIVPLLDQHILQIYQAGQALGRNPHNFSVIGDCQSIGFVFMGPFGRGILAPDSAESYLWDAINQFKDSFNRESITSRGGFTAASILSPLQADPHYCKPGETPLTCEYRLNNPAFVFITLETWLDPNTIDRYEAYLRQIVDYVIKQGSVPILLTKADSAEVFNGKYVINPAIVKVAHDFDVPVVNFWQAAQYISNGGIDPSREGFHLSQQGYDLKNILALRALYNVWKAVDQGGNGSSGSTTPTAVPAQEAISTSEPALQVTVSDCGGGCIFFGTAASHDGVVTSHGVYAYAYSDKKLTLVLGGQYDLQDVSEDGRRLLVNNGNRLYEVDLATASSTLISGSFFSFGKQDAYWNSGDSKVIFLDQNQLWQTDTGNAFNLFPSARDNERYFESGTCTSMDFCQSKGVYRLDSGQSTSLLDGFSRPVFSPDGKFAAYLDPTFATQENYYHIGFLLLEEPDRGIGSQRVFYFPQEHGFMIYPDVREYAFSPDSSKLFILYDVYSAYFEKSLHTESYMLDIKTGILYDYGKIDGPSGSLNPRMAWAPQGDKVLFFLTDETANSQYSLSIFQTELNTGKRLIPYDQGIMTSNDYFYITNIYWR
jgi:hypothetical protein